MNRIQTIGQLRAAGHQLTSVRDELRRNVAARVERGEPLFSGIVGYEETVIPQVVNALLSRHNFILLGLRGQAKTRVLRGIGELLDDESPAIRGCPLNSHPFAPLSKHARERVAADGDDVEIDWIPRRERYREKLATPDITVADLIGDIDPIKAAARKLDLDDEEVIHYGIIPRTNRGVFAINELPDLPTRIQVGLLNILEEKDIQIRGFPLRLPVDVLLVFTANPEDYTNRGSIITPLRDRIESQIHTHYPMTLADGMAITRQEAWTERGGPATVVIPPYIEEVIEEVAVQARTSSFVDQNSGVSARMTIALLENVVSNAERRAIRHRLAATTPRMTDLFAAAAAVTGKVELVYEGEREGATAVARSLIGKAIKAVFDRVLPDPYLEQGGRVYEPIQAWFRAGNRVSVADDSTPDRYLDELRRVPELESLARGFFAAEADGEARGAAMEFILDGLHQASILSKEIDLRGARYSDAFDEMAKELRGE